MSKSKEEIEEIIRNNVKVLVTPLRHGQLPTLETFLDMEYRTVTLNTLEQHDKIKYNYITQQFLFEAVKNNEINSLKKLVNNYKIDPKAIQDAVGKNALHHAAASNSTLEVVRYLLDININPTTLDNKHKTALDYATENTEAYVYLSGYTEGYNSGYNAGQDSLMEG